MINYNALWWSIDHLECINVCHLTIEILERINKHFKLDYYVNYNCKKFISFNILSEILAFR